jgi:hypothetical protein
LLFWTICCGFDDFGLPGKRQNVTIPNHAMFQSLLAKSQAKSQARYIKIMPDNLDFSLQLEPR